MSWSYSGGLGGFEALLKEEMSPENLFYGKLLAV